MGICLKSFAPLFPGCSKSVFSLPSRCFRFRLLRRDKPARPGDYFTALVVPAFIRWKTAS
jgi:hypothetical protein